MPAVRRWCRLACLVLLAANAPIPALADRSKSGRRAREVERLNVTVALCKCLRVSDTQLDEVLPLIFDRLAKLKHFPGDRVFADSNQKRKRFQEYKNGWAFKDLSERTGDDRPGGARHAGVGVPLEGILSAPARGG